MRLVEADDDHDPMGRAHRQEAAAYEAFLDRVYDGRPRPPSGVRWVGGAREAGRGTPSSPCENQRPASPQQGSQNPRVRTGDPVEDLTFEQAIEMQDLLIEEYKKEEFQERLHHAWAAAQGDRVKELKARQEICLPIQGPIVQRFGFEPSRHGVNKSTRAFRDKPWTFHPDIDDRNNMMSYLVNPPEQNTKWINGFEEAPGWWQRAQQKQTRSAEQVCREGVRTNPHDGVKYKFEELVQAYRSDFSTEELLSFWETGMQEAAGDGEVAVVPVSDDGLQQAAIPHAADPPALASCAGGDHTPMAVPKPLRPGAPRAEEEASSAPRALGPSSPAVQEPPGEQQPAASIDDAIEQLSRLQIMCAVPSVTQIRANRTLRRYDDELHVAQFVLQSTTRNFSKFLASEEGKAQFHPFLNPNGSKEEDNASFGWLDDKTYVVYQTNGIARTEEPIMNKPIKCGRTGAPGHYIETKMLVARRRMKGVPGQYGSGIKAARSFRTREDVEANLFYSWTCCWQMYACSAPVGELGDDDSGERIFIRRSAKDFTQHYFHDFPVAKHLSELLDRENDTLINAFSFNPAVSKANTLYHYHCYTLRSWQTYEFDEKPPEEDVGVQLVQAARIGSAVQLRQLVLEAGCDCDALISEFGSIGQGRNGCFTRSELGFAEERNALIAAVEAGFLSVVEVIIEFASQGKADLNIVCHEWNPAGIGGDCLRDNYTALDQAFLYHRDDIKQALLAANARRARQCPKPWRANPFDVRTRQDRGEYADSGWERKESQNRYADFTFVDPDDDVQTDPDIREIIQNITKELKEMGHESANYNKHFKKLCLRWHPDKHEESKKGLATRVFQWLQRMKVHSWENKAWTA